MDLEKRDSIASDALTLQEVEPSPVESPEVDRDDFLSPPTSSSPSPPLRSRSTTLGLGSHSPAYYLTRIQRYSSYVFTAFATAHITNTAILPLATRSVQSSDTYLLLTRPYYQSFPLEPILVAAPLTAHVLSGLALRIYRRRQAAKRYGAESRSERKRIPWPRVSGTSALGFTLAPLVGAHAFVNRILPLWQEGGNANIGLEYVSHGFARHPIMSIIVYLPLLGAVSFHVVWGWARWMGWHPEQVVQGGYEGRVKKRRRWYTINAVGAAVTALWMAGGMGIVGKGGAAQGWLAKEYDMLFSRIPLIGQWL